MLTFPNITPAVFEAVLNELRQSSAVTPIQALDGNVSTYTMEGSGIKAVVTYDSQRVEVNITAKPFFVSETMIGSKIRNAIDAAQARIARQGGAA